MTDQPARRSDLLSNDVGRMRRAHKGPAADLAKAITDLVWTMEVKHGSRWVVDETREPYLLTTGGALSVSKRSKRFTDYLVYTYGLAQSDSLTSLVVDALTGRIAFESLKVETARFSFWDQEEQVLYLNMHDGKVLRLDGEALRLDTNGSRVLFLDENGTMPYPERKFQVGRLRQELTGNLNLTDSLGASVASQRHLAYLWMLATCFPQYFPSKPIAIFSGDQGSGKSTATNNFQLTVNGFKLGHNVQKTDEADFYIKLVRSAPICALDNLDTFYPWLADLLCAYATGGAWERRRFYSQMDSLVIKPQTFIAISTRNPTHFSRVDLADRSLFFSFKRIDKEEGFEDDGAWTLHLLHSRPALISELIYVLNKVVAALKVAQPKKSRYRMSRFANFCLAAGPAAGIPLSEVETALEEAEKARQVVSGAMNPLVTMLEIVLARLGLEEISGTASDLLADYLAPEYRLRGMQLPDAKKLGKALSEAGRSDDGSVDVIVRQGSGGTHHYTVSLKRT